MRDLLELFNPHSNPSLAIFVSQTLIRLLLAAFLGGMIGLERERRGKAAGLRTNMFICFGSAMFTILSDRLASEFGGDHTRIAAQIIPGIGFIGAGSILHSKGGISGITTAATIFVVASIGMAAGGGLMLPAMFATLLLLLALSSLGYIERAWKLRPGLMTYQIEGENAEDLVVAANTVLSEENRSMNSVHITRVNSHTRLQFTVEATSGEHNIISNKLRSKMAAKQFACFSGEELD